MATVSATSTTATATVLTPPNGPHGNTYTWDSSLQQLDDSYPQNKSASSGLSNDFAAYNTHENGSSGEESLQRRGAASAYASPPQEPDHMQQDTSSDDQTGLSDGAANGHKPMRNGSANDSNKRSNTVELYGGDPEDTNSKWIHRDKLARIESEELQAAGIVLPQPRARSKPRRDISVDRANGHRKGGADGGVPLEPRSGRSSVFDYKAQDAGIPSWDLRLPEEIAAEAYFTMTSGAKGGSRIPVAKQSPVPIPVEHVERETMIPRKRGRSIGAADSLAYTKSPSKNDGMKGGDKGATMSQRNTARSTADTSPKKSASGPRKTSGKPNSNGRPKTRNGSHRDGNNGSVGSARPRTRSGEREFSPGGSGAANRCPEGDPPWMISAYRPDPRLPPDQQLLPTVAKRLQQEKWEREGKFGNIYDKDFRPLTDQGFLTPPEASEKEPQEAPASIATDNHQEWPLKPEARGPISPIGRTGSYSTIPRIQEKPNAGPISSPRGAISQIPEAGVIRAPSPLPDEDTAKAGCGCCIIM